MDLKLLPTHLEISIPRYFREDDKQRILERDTLMDTLLMEFHDTKNPEEEVYEDKPYSTDK